MLPDRLFDPGVLEIVLFTLIVAWCGGVTIGALWVWSVMRPKRNALVLKLAGELDANRALRAMNGQLAGAIERVRAGRVA